LCCLFLTNSQVSLHLFEFLHEILVFFFKIILWFHHYSGIVIIDRTAQILRMEENALYLNWDWLSPFNLNCLIIAIVRDRSGRVLKILAWVLSVILLRYWVIMNLLQWALARYSYVYLTILTLFRTKLISAVHRWTRHSNTLRILLHCVLSLCLRSTKLVLRKLLRYSLQSRLLVHVNTIFHYGFVIISIENHLTWWRIDAQWLFHGWWLCSKVRELIRLILDISFGLVV
jgi:hypothetical protein